MRYLFATTCAIAAMGVLLTGTAAAQGAPAPTGKVTITWAALNFYPSDYAAKALPTSGTTVSVSLEVVRGGKLQDLRNTPVAWYLDGEFLARGTGLKHTTFTATKGRGGAHALRGVVSLPEGDAEETMLIPIGGREVVIESPYRSRTAPAGGSLTFRAVPYFFNIASLSDLTFLWRVGGQTETTSGDNQLSVNFVAPGEGGLAVGVTARAIRSPLEFASDALELTMNP